MSRNYKSIAEPKTLNGNVTNVATQITLSNVTNLPSPPYVLVLSPDTANEEAVLVTVDQAGVSVPTLKVQRAIETDAVAQPHTSGNVVRHMIVGSDLQLVHDHLDNTTTAHGATGAVVGTTNSQTLTNKTLTTPKINENVALTATSTELNVLDGITASTAELNIMDGVTSTAAELNILDGATLTTAELNYVDGVTSSIQTQINTLVNNTPVGAVTMWVTGTAPTGWELCQGQELAITGTYNALANVIGTTYGNLTNGSGAVGTTHFRLPDLRGRAPIGAGLGRNVANDANLATSRTLGNKVSDDQTITLTAAQSGVPSHTHPVSISDPGHGHSFGPATVFSGENADWGSRYGAPEVGVNLDQPTYVSPNTTGITASTTGNTATAAADPHNNTQPSTVINFIIKF